LFKTNEARPAVIKIVSSLFLYIAMNYSARLLLYFFSSLLTLDETEVDDQEWTIQRHWQHWPHKMQDDEKQNKTNQKQQQQPKTQYRKLRR
jgi:hypothetical protein